MSEQTDGYTFTVKGKSYTLPRLEEDAAEKVPGDVFWEVAMGRAGDLGELRLGFATLEASDPDPAALAALKSLPTGEMMRHIEAWMGESSRSSE